MREVLSVELEAALVRELAREWHHVSQGYFKRKMRAPSLELVDHASTLGRWIPSHRTIELSRAFVLDSPWSSVVDVLKHEMAHQYVHEVLGRWDETAHGPTFREVCRTLGIDAAASGAPTSNPGDDATGEDRILSRISKLLALAESPNEHEAQAAMAAAQKLMLKYNLEAHARTSARSYAHTQVGRETGRTTPSERILARILGEHFFVQAIWVPVYRPREGRRASVLELCGTPANLEIARYVHAYLSETAERLWLDHRRAHAIAGDRDRRAFVAGVMSGFSDRLAAQQRAHAKEGLVWVGDRDLDDYLHRRHPYVRTVRRMEPRNEAFAHGQARGREIVLHKPMRNGPSEAQKLLR